MLRIIWIVDLVMSGIFYPEREVKSYYAFKREFISVVRKQERKRRLIKYNYEFD
ncbi:hypothetical protein [Ornithobacterium rhinotracheale]|uniref:hypothetical protein n=1 Tax=Ornithobacterium rhinotracheale TaxID=28251 RepID=UPI004035656D